MSTEQQIAPPAEMARNARSAAAYLKTLAHEGRLMILCHLGSGEKSVGELEALLDIRQAAVSHAGWHRERPQAQARAALSTGAASHAILVGKRPPAAAQQRMKWRMN